jgi:hypothetical protein
VNQRAAWTMDTVELHQCVARWALQVTDEGQGGRERRGGARGELIGARAAAERRHDGGGRRRWRASRCTNATAREGA